MKELWVLPLYGPKREFHERIGRILLMSKMLRLLRERERRIRMEGRASG